MPKRRSPLPVVAALLAGLLLGYTVRAGATTDSCTDWMRQPNGCDERVCTDGNGKQYCQKRCGTTITKISCF